jgi:hypothetical protein
MYYTYTSDKPKIQQLQIFNYIRHASNKRKNDQLTALTAKPQHHHFAAPQLFRLSSFLGGG